LDAAAAMAAPRVHTQLRPDTVLVEDAMPEAVYEGLRRLGHPVKRIKLIASEAAIRRVGRGWDAASDLRKLGPARDSVVAVTGPRSAATASIRASASRRFTLASSERRHATKARRSASDRSASSAAASASVRSWNGWARIPATRAADRSAPKIPRASAIR